jgi:hypothetical protein
MAKSRPAAQWKRGGSSLPRSVAFPQPPHMLRRQLGQEDLDDH